MRNVAAPLMHNVRSLLNLVRLRQTRETGVVFSGNLANKALTFVVHLVLIRALSVREFALFSVTVMVLEVLVELCDLGLNLGLVRNYSLYAESSPRRAQSLVRLILRAKVLWTFTLMVGLYFLAPVLCTVFLKKEELTAFVRLAAAGLAGPVLVYFLLAHLQAARLFFRYIFLSLFGRVILLATIALLAATGHFSPVTTLAAYVFVPFATIAAGFLLAPHEYLALRRLEPGVAREVFHFGKWVTVASVLVLAYFRLDVFMLTALSTEEQISYFVMAVRMASMFQTVTLSMTTALLPHVGRFQSSQQARAYVRQILSLVPALVVGVGVILLAARVLFVGMFGAKTEPAVAPFRILAVAYSIGIIASPASLILYRINRADLMCVINALQLATCFLANLLLIPRFGCVGAASAALAIRGVAALGILTLVPMALSHAEANGGFETETSGPGTGDAL